MMMKIRNTFIIFIVSGFWHGANWTFIIWGALNALYFLPLLVTNQNRSNLEIVAKGRLLPSMKELGQILLTFGLTVFAWIFFRAESLNHAFQYISQIFSKSLFSYPNPAAYSVSVILLILIFMLIEWNGREQKFALEKLGTNWSYPIRWITYAVMATVILVYSGKADEFIYFQF
jgi:D-alanyl-lipoteichoic acid acyltransferase DltB (MBOAT superfamily)